MQEKVLRGNFVPFTRCTGFVVKAKNKRGVSNNLSYSNQTATQWPMLVPKITIAVIHSFLSTTLLPCKCIISGSLQFLLWTRLNCINHARAQKILLLIFMNFGSLWEIEAKCQNIGAQNVAGLRIIVAKKKKRSGLLSPSSVRKILWSECQNFAY